MLKLQEGNDLTGSIPAELCLLPSIQTISIDCDQVQCTCCECGVGGGDSGGGSNDPLFDLLAALSADGGAALRDTSSPQYAAYQWLDSSVNDAYEDNERKLIQRYALASFYYSAGGENWESGSSSWLSSQDECTWYTTSPVSPCDQDGNFLEIDLKNNNLVGKLPLELLLLSDTLGKCISKRFYQVIC